MRRRLRVLTNPVFTGAVAVLALNDHVLKAAWPGLVTGKLSDVAGVVIVAIVLSMMTGRAVGVGLTAAAFVTLKAMPGVNVLAAPILGGITRTDPSDLIALAVLAPTYVWLGRVLSQRDDPPEPPQLRQWLRWSLGGCALGVAVLSTTATSCYPTEGVATLAAERDRIFAGTTYYPEIDIFDRGAIDTSWWVSQDGGESWSPTEHDALAEPGSRSTTEACDDQGVCWRVTPGERVDRCDPDGMCATAFRFTEAESDRMIDTDVCKEARHDEFNSVVLAPTTDGHRVVVAMGTEGVLIQHPDGEWTRRAVDRFRPTPIGIAPAWVEKLPFIAPVALITASPLLLLAMLRRRRGNVAAAFAVAFGGGFALVMVTAVLSILFAARYELSGLGITVAALGVFAISVRLALRPKQTPVRVGTSPEGPFPGMR